MQNKKVLKIEKEIQDLLSEAERLLPEERS